MVDWINIATGNLSEYEARRRGMESAAERIEILADKITGIRSAQMDGTPVSGATNRREDFIVNNIAERVELERSRQEAERWLSWVDSALNALDDEERLVLERMYIHRTRDSVDRLCDELCLQDARSVYKRLDKAKRRFTLMLYGCAAS